jgi:hypothetical protein
MCKIENAVGLFSQAAFDQADCKRMVKELDLSVSRGGIRPDENRIALVFK